MYMCVGHILFIPLCSKVEEFFHEQRGGPSLQDAVDASFVKAGSKGFCGASTDVGNTKRLKSQSQLF